MKLKRFLLQYSPPGVGLEFMEGEETYVRHQDMPPAEEVNSLKDIEVLVNQIISTEELLSKRRHYTAIHQLLCRLYEMEPDNEDPNDSDGGALKEKASLPGNSPTSEEGHLKEGQMVCLIGLKGKLQVHNGEVGQLVKCNYSKGKFEVMMQSGEQETVKVKCKDHIVPVAAKGTPLSVGGHVVIRGLRNHVELNGCLGKLVECHEEQHRFEVRATESGQLFRVKQDNLVPIDMCPQVLQSAANAKENAPPNTNSTPRVKKDAPAGASSSVAGDPATASAALHAGASGDEDTFEPGSTIQLVGLKTAQVYNGQHAEVISVDRARGRYEIRLSDDSVKTIRAENVRYVGPPVKTSPRTRRQKA